MAAITGNRTEYFYATDPTWAPTTPPTTWRRLYVVSESMNTSSTITQDPGMLGGISSGPSAWMGSHCEGDVTILVRPDEMEDIIKCAVRGTGTSGVYLPSVTDQPRYFWLVRKDPLQILRYDSCVVSSMTITGSTEDFIQCTLSLYGHGSTKCQTTSSSAYNYWNATADASYAAAYGNALRFSGAIVKIGNQGSTLNTYGQISSVTVTWNNNPNTGIQTSGSSPDPVYANEPRYMEPLCGLRNCTVSMEGLWDADMLTMTEIFNHNPDTMLSLEVTFMNTAGDKSIKLTSPYNYISSSDIPVSDGEVLRDTLEFVAFQGPGLPISTANFAYWTVDNT